MYKIKYKKILRKLSLKRNLISIMVKVLCFGPQNTSPFIPPSKLLIPYNTNHKHTCHICFDAFTYIVPVYLVAHFSMAPC